MLYNYWIFLEEWILLEAASMLKNRRRRTEYDTQH